MSQEPPAFKIRNASFPLFVVHALTPDLDEFKQRLAAHMAQAPDFFAGAPVVLGLAALAADRVPDFADLIAFMAAHGMPLAGVQGGTEAQRQVARSAGLGVFPDQPARARPAPEAPSQTPVDAPGAEPAPVAANAQPAPVAEPPQAAPVSRPTLIVDKPVRTGQRIHAEGADLVVLAVVNPGAELIADGDIHVYAPLRGRALAGARGNTAARIFVREMAAELVSIAGLFQVFEDGIPQALRGKPAQVYLDGERVVVQPLAAARA